MQYIFSITMKLFCKRFHTQLRRIARFAGVRLRVRQKWCAKRGAPKRVRQKGCAKGGTPEGVRQRGCAKRRPPESEGRSHRRNNRNRRGWEWITSTGGGKIMKSSFCYVCRSCAVIYIMQYHANSMSRLCVMGLKCIRGIGYYGQLRYIRMIRNDRASMFEVLVLKKRKKEVLVLNCTSVAK